MEAANGGYVDVGELLLNAGADPNAGPVPSSRDTALTIAADKGHHKFVEMLIHARAVVLFVGHEIIFYEISILLHILQKLLSDIYFWNKIYLNVAFRFEFTICFQAFLKRIL